MPSLGLGLSLGSSNPKPGFDPDAWGYILSNNIVNSAPYYVTNNNYLELSGGYLSVSNNSELQTGSSKCLSFSFWFKTPSSLSFPKIIFGKEVEYAFYLQSLNQIQFLIGPSSGGGWATGTAYNTPSNFTANTWYHCVFVYDRINSVAKVFLNGSQLGTTLNYAGGGTTFGTATTNAFILGEKVGQISSSNFLGGLKHFGIWTRELTSTEITWIYNSGTPRTNNEFGTGNGSNLNDTNLKYYWRFDEDYSDVVWYVNQAYTSGLGDITSKTGSVGTNISESSILYTNPQQDLNNFIVGIKNLGLWSNMYIVPFRKYQNKVSSSLGSFGGLALVTTTINFWNSSAYLDNIGMLFRGGSVSTNYVPPNGNASFAVVANGFPYQTGADNRMLLSVDHTSLGRKLNIYLSVTNLLLEANHSTGMATRFTTFNFASQFKSTGNFFSQYSHNGTNYTLGLNNSANTTASGSGTLSGTYDSITFGNRPSSPATMRGTISLGYWANTDISSSFSAIYSLYKNTLGKGLGLP